MKIWFDVSFSIEMNDSIFDLVDLLNIDIEIIRKKYIVNIKETFVLKVQYLIQLSNYDSFQYLLIRIFVKNVSK